LVITRICSVDGLECSGDEFFRRGGYLNNQPNFGQQNVRNEASYSNDSRQG
jgi:hypothetical protein